MASSQPHSHNETSDIIAITNTNNSNTTGSCSSDEVSNGDGDCSITVKLSSNRTLYINVKRTTMICDIKELVKKKTDHIFLNHNLNLIFAGQLLDDKKTVEDYNLDGQTTIHAFNLSNETPGVNRPSDQVSLTDSHYFVYCKICDCIRPGKLRVCCRRCDSHLFVVEQGPSSWEDLSADSPIRGQCKNDGCDGKVPRFFMKCSCFHNSEEKEGDGTTVALKHIRANEIQVECIICQDIVSPILIFPCPPSHVICLECFKGYAINSLNSRQFVEHEEHGYTLSCPSGSCEDYLIEDSHHFCMMGKSEYERYKNFGAEEFVLRNGGVLCPSPDCGMGLFPEDNHSMVQCSECQFVSCKHCKREFHIGSCEENLQSEMRNTHRLTVNSEMAQRASWESQSLAVIEEISKACPECKVKTQHSGGCMHMTCSRCHTNWCWLCVKPWDSGCQENHWFA